METDPSQPEPEVARPVESSKETANSPSESDSNSNPTTLMSKPIEPESQQQQQQLQTEVVENVTTQPLSPVAAKNTIIEPKEEAPSVIPPTSAPIVPLATPPTTYASPSAVVVVPPAPVHSTVPTPTNIPQPTTTAVITTSQSQPPLVQSTYSESITPVPNATPPHHPIPQTTHHNMPPHIVPHQGQSNCYF